MVQPLKNKKFASLGTSPYTMGKDTIVYFEDDIKSAVEWLLQRKLGNKLKAVNFEGEEMLVFYKKDFEEAFVDLKIK